MSWGDWNGSNPEYEKGSPLGLNGRCAEAIKRALIFWAGSVDSLVRTCIESPPQKNLYFFNKDLHGVGKPRVIQVAAARGYLVAKILISLTTDLRFVQRLGAWWCSCCAPASWQSGRTASVADILSEAKWQLEIDFTQSESGLK
jgi:hypothetical protein